MHWQEGPASSLAMKQATACEGDNCRLMGLVQQLATWTHSLHLMLGVSKRWGYREKPLQSFKACKKP